MLKDIILDGLIAENRDINAHLEKEVNCDIYTMCWKTNYLFRQRLFCSTV